MNIPVYIIAYNNLYYVKKMVNQLEKYTKNINIIDNKSTYQELLDYYENEYKYVLIKMPKNCGHIVYLKEFFYQLPEKFIITDPDLELNPELPNNFIAEMDKISEKYKVWKVGFALDISDHDKMFPDKDYLDGYSIYDFESQYWKEEIEKNIYVGGIDTTFCLCNKKYLKNSQYVPALRMAGNFTAKHLPWYIDNWKNFPQSEIDFYDKNNISSTIMKLVKRWIK
jgi:hypothetical protein